MNGRPGASGPSRTLTDFTMARYVRIRMRRLRLLPEDEQFLSGGSLLPSSSDGTTLRRYFYSLRDITIGGQCPCNGHASECNVQHSTMVVKNIKMNKCFEYYLIETDSDIEEFKYFCILSVF